MLLQTIFGNSSTPKAFAHNSAIIGNLSPSARRKKQKPGGNDPRDNDVLSLRQIRLKPPPIADAKLPHWRAPITALFVVPSTRLYGRWFRQRKRRRVEKVYRPINTTSPLKISCIMVDA